MAKSSPSGFTCYLVVVANVRGPARARRGVPPGTPGEAPEGVGAEPGGGRRKAEKR